MEERRYSRILNYCLMSLKVQVFEEMIWLRWSSKSTLPKTMLNTKQVKRMKLG